MKKMNSLENRLIALTLCIIMVLGMLPSSVFAANDADDYATVTGLSGNVEISGDGEKIHAVVTGTLNWVAKDESIGRNNDGWWAGIRVTAPANADLTKAYYLSGNETIKFTDVEDSAEEHYVDIWRRTQESWLRDANLTDGLSTYILQFNWDGDDEGVIDQTVYIDFDSDKITLLGESGEQVYPAAEIGYGKLEMLTGGAVITGNETADIQASYTEDITVAWVPADDTIGRYQDGWWAGMQITAPSGMTEEQLKNAQYKNRKGVRSFWTNKDSQEGDAVHFMRMWVPLNEVLTDGLSPYTYQFDWNNDGIFEQSVTLTVDADKVTLTQDAVQVYPVLGQVSSYNGGTVTGSGTGEVSVLIDDVTLDWVEADDETGRTQGWWVGIRVEAPVGLDAATLEGAKLQLASGESVNWATVTQSLSFWGNKDSADGDAAHHIQLWMPLSAAILQEAGEGDVTRWYRFDWDGDGEYDQQIKFSVDAQGSITLNKKDQTGFGFSEESYNDQWVGATFQEKADGGQTGLDVLYEIVSGPATITQDGVVTFTGVGKVTVKATRPGNEFYNDAPATYVVTAVKNPWEPFAFATSNPVITYKEGLQYPNAEQTNDLAGKDANVTYAIVDGDELVQKTDVAEIDAATGILTILQAGTVTVRATRAEDDKYKTNSAEYTLTVDPADQTISTDEDVELTWQQAGLDPETVFPLTGAMGNGAVQYVIPQEYESVAKMEDGKLVLLKAGNFKIEITKSGDKCYNASNTVTVNVTVKHADQSDLSFAITADTITYNDNSNVYTQIATQPEGGAKSSKDIIYQLKDGENLVSSTDVAEVTDSANGVLKIKQSGTVTIVATRPGDDQYNSVSTELVLTVEKDDQSFTFDHEGLIELSYGQTFQTKITPAALNSGKVTYGVSQNNIGVKVNEDGLVSFEESEERQGEVTITVTLEGDVCYNSYSQTYTVKVDYETKPATAYILGGTVHNGWFTGDVTISAPDGYQISYKKDLAETNWNDDPIVWGDKGGVHGSGDGYAGAWPVGSEPVVYLRNKLTGGITDAISVSDLKRDTTDPVNLSISYEESVWKKILSKIFVFHNDTVEVTVSAEDATSGIAKLEYSLDSGDNKNYTEVTAQNGVYKFSVPAEKRGQVWLKATDVAGNDTVIAHKDGDVDKILVVDSAAPGVNISYQAAVQGETVGFPYNKDTVTAIITVTEDNFFEGDVAGANNDEIVHEILIKVTKTDDYGNVTVTEYLCAGAKKLVSNADATETITWTPNNGVYEATPIVLDKDGDYVLEVSYCDFSGNKAGLNDGNGEVEMTYTSSVITVDKKAPVIEVAYDNNTVKNGNNYQDNRVATITVTEHNFKPEDFKLFDDSGDSDDYLAVDIFGGEVSVADYAAMAADPANWYYRKADDSLTKDVSEAADPNKHILQLTFSTDAVYDFDVSYEDLAGNADTGFDVQSFVVDHAEAKNIRITYSKPVFERVLETLSFGFYQADVVVTVTAEDLTSGVDYFELTYTRDDKASDAHTDDFTQTLEAKQNETDAKTFTASYTLSAQARGSFSVKVVDRAGKESGINDHGNVIVTDTVSPEIKVNYAGKDSKTTVNFVDGSAKDVATFEQATNAFYNGNVIAKITVDEANFFEGKKAGENNDEIVHEILIKVTKTDDEGKKTVTEYLCAGAKQLVSGSQKKEIVWTPNGDTYTTSIEFDSDGDYVLEITYSDFSKKDSKLEGNDGVATDKTYTSKVITVDKTAPVIQVAYGNTEVINTIENRKYFDKVQTAVITVAEHNFRAADIAAAVTAKDVVGKDVAVADFAAQLADSRNWTHSGNVHTAKVEYSVDANYTFDISYQDMAKNASADYAEDLFTVDQTAPANLTVSYSTNVFQEILESITFGYYNAQMTVTITAEDDTTGILHFAYSYIKGKDVSDVNAELLDEAIQAAQITYDGKKATATFTVPKMVLGNDNQFNGTVQFSAFDRSENRSDLKDSTVIIVDNISPVANITYNAPVQNANGISYYAGNIHATIVINEANFDAGDVVVAVTKDGVAFPVNVAWRDDSVDTHTGTFTLTNDGDYIVSVQYADKSGNQMAAYTSNELTLDATKPVIHVSDIKANSANKDEKYGFVISVTDTNLDASSIKPVLKAVKKNAEGVYETVEIDLGKAVTVVNGQAYTFTVENLPDDALYTLTCEVKDMSANGIAQVVLEDGETYDQVSFSINRDGSVFGYGNTFTEELVEQYYIYSVEEDVVIVEVNVDPVEKYKVTLNGKELVEGTDYTSVQTSKDGEWSKRTYTVKKDLFVAEGEYSIVVSSTDKADTTAFSDVKNLSLAFVVDQTKPVLTITGLEANGRYQTDAQTVTLIPTDEGGRLSELTVVVLDSNGNPLTDESGTDISVRFTMSGDELLQYLAANDGKITFTIPEGLNNQVKIICNDCAVGGDELTNEYNELFARVTVSQNQLVIFYANTPLFVGTIVGVLAVIALIIILIKRKKDKKSKAKTNH